MQNLVSTDPCVHGSEFFVRIARAKPVRARVSRSGTPGLIRVCLIWALPSTMMTIGAWVVLCTSFLCRLAVLPRRRRNFDELFLALGPGRLVTTTPSCADRLAAGSA